MAAPSERDGIPLVRSSERGSFKNCQWAWWQGYVRQIVPITTDLGAREEGTGIHLAMAEYYIKGTRRGRPMVDTWLEWCEEYRKNATKTEKGRNKWVEKDPKGVTDKERFDEMKARGVHILSEYMKKYGEYVVYHDSTGKSMAREKIADPNWEVIATEQTFAANINGQAINVGTIDLVVRDTTNGEIWIVDHKTGKGFPNEWWYRIDDQGGSYGAIGTIILRRLGLIGPTERVKGIIFNFIVKRNEDKRPRNADGLYCNKPLKKHFVEQLLKLYIDSGDARDYADDKGVSLEVEVVNERKRLSKLKLEELEAEAFDLELEVFGDVSERQPPKMFDRYRIERTASQQKRQLQRVIDDVFTMKKVRDGELPVLKSPGKLCPYCDFAQLCELDESGGDVDGMVSVLFKPRDPYHDHREGAENSKLSVKADANLKH